MASGETYSLKAVLSCVDNLSPTFDKVRKKLKVVDRSFADVTEQVSGLALKLAAPLAALAGASGLSLSNAVTGFVELGTSIDAAAKRAGIGVEALQKLRLAAELGGSSADDMDDALSELSLKMGEALAGDNEDATKLFKEMGIAIADSSGKARNAAVVMRELAEAMKVNANNADRLRALDVLLGGDVGKRLLPVLQDGAAGLDSMAKRADELGIVLDATDVKASVDLSESFTLFGKVLDSVTAKIGAGVAPVLIRLIDQIQRAVIANKDLIATQLEKFFVAVSDAISNVDFSEVIEGVFDAARGFFAAIDAIGGFKTIVYATGLILGAQLLANLIHVTTAVVGLSKAVWALTGPWGVVLAGATALFAYCYSEFEGFRAWCEDIGGAVMDLIAGNFGGAAERIREAWEELKTFFAGIFDWIESKVKAIPMGIVNLFTPDSGIAPVPALSSPIPSTQEAMQGRLDIRVTTDQGTSARIENMQTRGGDIRAETQSNYTFVGTD